MTSHANLTPFSLPWIALGHSERRWIESQCGDYLIAEQLMPSNAEYIVRACNSHNDLIEALEALAGYAERHLAPDDKEGQEAEEIGAQVIAALAKAKGSQ